MSAILFISDCLRGDCATSETLPLVWTRKRAHIGSWDSVHGFTGPAMITMLTGQDTIMIDAGTGNPYGRRFSRGKHKAVSDFFNSSIFITNSPACNKVDGWDRLCTDYWMRSEWDRIPLRELVDEALTWLKVNAGLVIIFSVETHSNVHPKRDYSYDFGMKDDNGLVNFTNVDANTIKAPNSYLSSIRRTDEQLLRLIEYGCPVIFTGDHGDVIYEHGGMFHLNTNTREQFPEQFRVPLLTFNTNAPLSGLNGHFDMCELIKRHTEG